MVQLEDTDNNVRFYACESLYNVIKVNSTLTATTIYGLC